jgi:sugar lactone lactonase YvrE
MPKQVYQIDPCTREYIAPATAYENPQAKFDGVPFNIPGSCVEEAPPEKKDGFAIVREGNSWTHVADNRGKIMYLAADKSPKMITELGPIPDGYTFLVPGRFDVWSKTKWKEDSDAAVATKKEENNASVKAALLDNDAQSIRALREWVMSQPDAPQITKDHEKAAQALRKNLMK